MTDVPDSDDPAGRAAAMTRAAETRLDEMSRLGVAMAAADDVAGLTSSIVETAARLTGATAARFLERAPIDDPARPETWLSAQHPGEPLAAFVRADAPWPSVLSGPDAPTAVAIRSDDVAADPRFDALRAETPGMLGIRSYLAVVIASRKAGVIGALLFGHPEPGRFGEREARFVAGFAAQTAVAIENARLVASLVAENEERRAAEASLRRSDARFRAAIGAVQGVLWTNNADGRMEGEQPGWAALTGQRYEDYQGYGWAAAVHPEDAPPTIVAWNEAVAERRTFIFEHRVRCRDGVYRTFALRGVPVLDEASGEIREWVGVHTDITERREAEARVEAAREAAEAANRAKSQFIANMSHELRTPLSAVIGYSEMLGEEIADLGHAGLVEDVRKIESNARHLLGLINDVLDLSKIEAGRMTVESVTFDVAAMIADVADAARPLAAKKANAFRLDLAPDLGVMQSDEVKIRQCLLNLVGNAAKFTENGIVTLRARRHSDGGEDWLGFSVEDSGIGMTPDQLSRLFQRFVQADESTTRQFGGTGLGLSITRAFCRKLGGDVAVESRHGFGSTFTISLPALLDGTALEAAEADPAPIVPGRGDIVLVVDDDSAARELLTRFLDREGFEVKTARDGREGLALARRFHPRLVLLDIEMPNVDGWAVLQAIRSDPVLFETPVIMTSVLHERSVGFAMGANDYLVKPIEWAALKRVVDRFGRGRGARRILVVDDEPDARGWLGAMLSRDGWDVEMAADGRDALDKIDRAMPDLIVLDLMMPVMDGFAFLHTLRARDDAAHVHVVVLTAKEVTHAERADLDRGADRVIRKGSLRLDELRAELRRLVPEGSAPPRETVHPGDRPMSFDPQVLTLFGMMDEANLPPIDRMSVAEARAVYRAQPGRLGGPVVAMAAVEDLAAEGPAGPIPLRLYRPRGAPGRDAPLLVYYHGGGWVIGDLDTHDRVCREIAERAGCLVAAVDYRLAPEHPAPAAAEDAVAALTFLRRHAEGLGADPARLAVGGDSAGGNLAAVAALSAHDAGLALAAQILIYPAVDLRRDVDRYPSIVEKAEVRPLTRAGMDWFVAHYAPDEATAADWRVSPILARDLAGLAPALVIVAEHDVLRDEGLAYADALAAAGVPVERIAVPGLIHGFVTMGGVLDAAPTALDRIAATLRSGFGS